VKLSGKVAIVTGAGGGIGRAASLRFAQEGAKVTAIDINAEHIAQTAELAGKYGGEVIAEVADVGNESQIKAGIDRTVTRWGRLDVLFNNAGIVMVKSVEAMTEEEWDRLMSVNLKAVFLGCKHAIPHLRRAGGGAILNTGSIGSFTGQLGTPAYIASKGAVALFTKSLALDYGRDGIRVNCICPGITDTPMLREHMGYGKEGEANIRARLARVPLGKILSPDDVAKAALYLVCDDSQGITGITHIVDGGLLAAAEYNVPLKDA
jgi:NAD(P)-dependent dehydrogenase (short-subunit alcohol dehydrogenase family)